MIPLLALVEGGYPKRNNIFILGIHFITLKKVYRKRIVRSVLILLPFLVVAGVVLYIRLRGFREALEDLVEAESSGQYSLVIGKSSVDISQLSFTFGDLTIQRNQSALQSGIRVVKIPYLSVRFGSVASMLILERFDIEQFVMEEPTIEIDEPNKQRNPSKDDINLAQQIVQLHPAIQSLLGRFDIKSLTINRASVSMNKSGVSFMRLNLVDLLVKQWDVRRLTSSSQLLLKVGGQDLNFGKANLNFSGIEFNFQEHHLMFSDFNFSSVDTISNSDIRVSGKSLILQQLDYKDLYENKRYSIKRAEIVNPVVSAHFKLKQRTTNVDSKSVITRLVKHTLGECSVDSAIIRDARVHIVIQQDKDSVKVQLPRVNFKLHAFKVLADSNTFQVGGIEIGLNRTAIALKKDMSLHCDGIFFDTQRNLGFTKVTLFDSAKRETIAQCEKLKLRDFDLLDFVFYKHFVASAVSLENGFIQIHGLARHLSPRKKPQGIRDVVLHKVSLKNVALRYSDATKNISADNLSVLLNRVRRDTAGGFLYDIENISLRYASLHHISERMSSQVKNLNFDGRHVNAKEINVQGDSLSLQIKDFVAEKLDSRPIQKYFRRWKSASIRSLNITGRLPSEAKGTNKSNAKEDISFGRIIVNTLTTSISKSETSLVLTGSNIEIDDVTSSREGLKHGDITGTFSDIVARTSLLSFKAGKVALDFPMIVRATKVEIEKEGLSIRLPSILFRSILRKQDHWAIDQIHTREIAVSKSGKQILKADSIHVAGTEFPTHAQPVINKLEVFQPEIFLVQNETKTHTRKEPELFRLPKNLVVHPGVVHLQNNKRIAFGKVQGNIADEALKCAFIRLESQKMQVRLNGLSVQHHNLTIDAVHLTPIDGWFKANLVEDDLIHADLYGIHVTDFYKDHLLDFKLSKKLSVQLENFEVDVKRDKRQTDPPEKEKPTTLEGLIKLPTSMGITSVDVKRGRIRYTETSEKTSADGVVVLEDILARVEFDTTRSRSHVNTLKAEAKLYNSGHLDLHYATLDSSSFKFALQLKDFDLTNLNQIVVPLQSLQIKSGYLNHYRVDVTADREKALGTATITYRNLHLEIFKATEPEKKTFGTELLTLLADGIILKHSKKNALVPIEQPRVKHKSIFNYWVKSAVHGAMSAIRKGKTKKHT